MLCNESIPYRAARRLSGESSQRPRPEAEHPRADISRGAAASSVCRNASMCARSDRSPSYPVLRR